MKRLPVVDYTNHPAYSVQEISGDTVRSALEAFEPILFRKMGLLRESEDVFRSRVTSHRDSTVATFAQDGAVAMSISAKDLDAVRAASARFETELRERINGKRRIRLRFRETQFLVHSDTEVVSGFEGLHAALQTALERSGALEVAEAYFGGHKASLARTVYRINVAGQPFYNNLFSDTSIQLPQTTGFHIDANGRPAINGTLYLSDVAEGQGAFENVTGSNHWAFELEDRAIRKTFDDRIIRSDTERFLMSLPRWFRRRANFGHDLVEGSEEARQVLDNRHSFIGEAGSLILFDPDAVHRGGDVRKGERIAIIFGLQMARRS